MPFATKNLFFLLILCLTRKNNSARPAELCPWCADYSYNTKLLDITNTRQKLINVPNTIIPIKERRSHWEESNHLI
jgi:hypothetical protein